MKIVQTIAFATMLMSGLAAAQITPKQFVIDGAKPYVYIKFDHIGDRKPTAENEETKGLWLRLVNNCTLPITVVAFDLGTGDRGVGVYYSVVQVNGPHGPSEKQLKKMPHGYMFDVGTSVKISPGKDLLFSVPLDRVKPEWYIQLRFDLVLPGPKDGYNPYSLVDFSWDDIPKKERFLKPLWAQ